MHSNARIYDPYSTLFGVSLIYIFTIPFEGAVTMFGFATMTRVIGAFMATLWVVAVLKRGLRPPHLFNVLVLAFVLWNLVSVYWSIDPDLTVKRVVTYAQLAIMTMIFYDLYTTPSALRLTLQAYVLGCYVSIVSALINYFSGASIGEYEHRYTGASLDANVFALILSLSIPIAWHLATFPAPLRTRGVMKLINLVQIPAALFVITLTASRMALFAAAPGLIFILMTLMRSKTSIRIPLVIMLAGATFGLAPFVPESSIDRLATTSSSISDRHIGGRYEAWDEAMDLFAQHPILGVGSGASSVAATKTRQVAHNTFLSLLAENGIIGCLLFIIILVVGVYQALRKPLWNYGLWLTIAVTWTIGASVLSLEYEKLTWVFLSLGIAGGCIRHDQAGS